VGGELGKAARLLACRLLLAPLSVQLGRRLSGAPRNGPTGRARGAGGMANLTAMGTTLRPSTCDENGGVSMMLHPAIEDVLRSGTVATADGRVVRAHSYMHIPRDECELLYRQMAATRATQAIEVGMAFGISTLCLCDALRRNTRLEVGKRPHLVVIDPFQHGDIWQGVGLEQIRSAGFSDVVEFHERPSQAVLPELAAKEHPIQFAFIDGSHMFDEALIDFFYLDQMLEIGGVIVFDDVGLQPINAVVRFVLANRDYELVEVLEQLRTEQLRTRVVKRGKRFVKRFLRRLGQTDKDPAPGHQQLFRLMEGAYSVALRKVAPDSRPWDRPWDHYHAF
jgi:predicted O-methyltransferase YrrM